MKNNRGFTLIEINVALLIIGILSLTLVGWYTSVSVVAARMMDINMATAIASGLMDEIRMRAWDEGGESATLGPDTGETDKTKYDDIDDFNNYSENPVLNPDLTPAVGYETFSVYSTVSYVQPDLSPAAGTSKRKKIVVKVKKWDKYIYSLAAIMAQK